MAPSDNHQVIAVADPVALAENFRGR